MKHLVENKIEKFFNHIWGLILISGVSLASLVRLLSTLPNEGQGEISLTTIFFCFIVVCFPISSVIGGHYLQTNLS